MVRDRPSADTNPQNWTDEEEDRLLEMIEEDKNKSEMYSAFSGRPSASIDNKVRRLKKENGLYNSSYAEQKYDTNREWIELIYNDIGRKARIFDAYAGVGDSSLIYDDYASEIIATETEDEVYKTLSETLDADNHTVINEDCVDELMRRKIDDESFDYIDLDPFGTPFDAVPLAISLITNGYLAVTYGDIKLQRWGRSNPLVKQYKMPETTDWMEVAQYIVGWTVFEGIRQRESSDVRTLEPVSVKNFGGQSGVLRVLYKVEKTGVLSDALERYESKSIDTGQPIPNRPYDLSSYLDEKRIK
jgi:hypothetical protein